MTPIVPPTLLRQQWLVDDYLWSYIRWREECVGVQRAYKLWRQAERADRVRAFAAYGEALDREEHAATALAEQTRWWTKRSTTAGSGRDGDS